MIIGKLVVDNENILSDVSDTAHLDIQVLLSHVLNQDRSWILAHPEYKLNDKQEKTLNSFIARRRRHEPIAYILGKSEFYGREFYVNKNVLVPRPESETIIDLLKDLNAVNDSIIVDVGTGSGSLAITANLEFPETKVFAVDIDNKALKVARKNAKRLHANVKFINSDLLDSTPSSIIKHHSPIFLCNLPYVPEDYQINEAAEHEPNLALFSGIDGLDHYRKLFDQLKVLKSAVVVTESLAFQHAELTKIAESAGFKLTNEQDLIQVYKRT